MRRFLALAAIALITLGCASGRQMQYTFTKSNVSQMQAMTDADRLKGSSGVEKVIPQVDSLGNARLEVYVDEENAFPGVRRAMEELGYRMVSP